MEREAKAHMTKEHDPAFIEATLTTIREQIAVLEREVARLGDLQANLNKLRKAAAALADEDARPAATGPPAPLPPTVAEAAAVVLRDKAGLTAPAIAAELERRGFQYQGKQKLSEAVYGVLKKPNSGFRKLGRGQWGLVE